MKKMKEILIIPLVLLISIIFYSTSHATQSEASKRPIDMMILIDNSCSMFPKDKILAGCTSWGSDPDFLRISGAYLFIARLGFAEINESQYQVGIVGIGAEARMISPLQPVFESRDKLAALLTNPMPEGQTQVVPALKTAYEELRTSSARKVSNLPAIVVITDGVPWPAEGQSNNEIAALLRENPDIPVFIMLLQSAEQRSSEYQSYIKFWQQMQAETKHIFVYKIDNPDQIEKTYNEIIAQLQNTIPSKGIVLDKGQPLSVFVSRYVQKIVITVIHENRQFSGTVTTLDPTGVSVDDGQPGVGHFRGSENPVEVISISPPRLAGNLKESFWTITSDEKVVVFLDREGAYRVNFLSPEVSLTDLTNVYLATKRQTPKQDFKIRFNLIMDDGTVVSEHQPIQGKVSLPNGEETSLLIPSEIQPDENGTYEVTVSFADLYPTIENNSGRFVFEIKAGSADDRSDEQIPIASGRFMVDVGPGPYVSQVLPTPVQCKPGELSNQITIELGDLNTVKEDSLKVRLFSQGTDLSLSQSGVDKYVGDIAGLCAPIVSQAKCSTFTQTSFQLRISGQLKDGSTMGTIDITIPVEVHGIACTPTPLPPTPTPSPALVPDTDSDGINDLVDNCPDVPKWDIFNYFEGCPPPIWFLFLVGILGLFVLAFVVFYLSPWVKVRWISPPPKAYVMACLGGKEVLPIKSIYAIGIDRRTNKVTIGGGKNSKAHIIIREIKEIEKIEYVIEQRNKKVVLVDVKTGASKVTLDENPTPFPLPNTQVVLRVGLDRSRMNC